MWYKAGGRICLATDNALYIFYGGSCKNVDIENDHYLFWSHKEYDSFSQLPLKYIKLHYLDLLKYVEQYEKSINY